MVRFRKTRIIKGKAEKVAAEISDAYFSSRPLGSQLGAIVLNQSEVISSRELLEKRLADLEATYKDIAPKRPEHWGGILVRPTANRILARSAQSFTRSIAL